MYQHGGENYLLIVIISWYVQYIYDNIKNTALNIYSQYIDAKIKNTALNVEPPYSFTMICPTNSKRAAQAPHKRIYMCIDGAAFGKHRKQPESPEIRKIDA